MSDPQPLLTYDYPGAAETTGLSVRTLRHLVATRRIPFVRFGRMIRFRAIDLEAWMRANTVPAHEDAVPQAVGATGSAAVAGR